MNGASQQEVTTCRYGIRNGTDRAHRAVRGLSVASLWVLYPACASLTGGT